jgi:hypothetical protein
MNFALGVIDQHAVGSQRLAGDILAPALAAVRVHDLVTVVTLAAVSGLILRVLPGPPGAIFAESERRSTDASPSLIVEPQKLRVVRLGGKNCGGNRKGEKKRSHVSTP